MHRKLETKSVTDQRTATVRMQRKQLSETGQFEGYGSVFGVKDSYGEIVAPGAFTESLNEHRAQGSMPALLWQHDARQPIGAYVEMREDEKGLFVKGQLTLDTEGGRTAHALLKAGAINGLSIGFMPEKWEYDEEEDVRTLTKIDLWECSLVTFPANGQSRVSGTKALDRISSIADWKSFEENLRDEGGFSQKTATAMVAAAKRIRDSERDAQGAKANVKSSADKLLTLLKS
ncbi:HK97 family phage prohead protease [uncultured Roseobacter sp.]|uniref:HK97 family phage prohead protease n=1 Tax=uncultured Roseobacter sp. TaxID=114847 RepID=UPI002628C9C4|nr:HK97 family phage prohead protease [uncultured Roseobacter sp.]